jgi:hypothetical protein
MGGKTNVLDQFGLEFAYQGHYLSVECWKRLDGKTHEIRSVIEFVMQVVQPFL